MGWQRIPKSKIVRLLKALCSETQPCKRRTARFSCPQPRQGGEQSCSPHKETALAWQSLEDKAVRRRAARPVRYACHGHACCGRPAALGGSSDDPEARPRVGPPQRAASGPRRWSRSSLRPRRTPVPAPQRCAVAEAALNAGGPWLRPPPVVQPRSRSPATRSAPRGPAAGRRHCHRRVPRTPAGLGGWQRSCARPHGR